jgi:hypothetical protein
LCGLLGGQGRGNGIRVPHLCRLSLGGDPDGVVEATDVTAGLQLGDGAVEGHALGVLVAIRNLSPIRIFAPLLDRDGPGVPGDAVGRRRFLPDGADGFL